ncbi:MAG: TraB/GumN family protein [Pseudomonadota bacterium]
MREQPKIEVAVGDTHVTLLGTAHVSRVSAEAVSNEIASGNYDLVAVELCNNRHRAMVDPDAVARMDLIEVLRTGKAPMIMAMLAMGAFQQRIAEQFDIEPGAEMKAAISGAAEQDLSLKLIDRDIGVTLRRIYRNVPWWRRMYLFSGLFGSVLVDEAISEDDIEQLKEGDLLENTFAQFAESSGPIYEPLIAERDKFMAAKLLELSQHHSGNVLAVIGAGHLKGIAEYLRNGVENLEEEIIRLASAPPKAKWPKVLPWLIVALIFLGFGIGFSRSPELGLSLVAEWVFINGGLAALGVIIAGGHPITILSGFFAAPLTSLNPTIGAGVVTAMVEGYLRKPTVGDFSALRTDTTSFKGWRRNRVARTLLVFFFSTLGSAIGTYLAGFRIFDKLVS